MNFDAFDAQMRAYEFQKETRVPGGFLIARLDGRGFTRLTKESLSLEKPFDMRFHQSMSATLAHLFDCGFAVRLGYSQSDEISLLFEQDGIPFDRKIYKLLSVLAGEASAKFSMEMGYHGAFDCRLSVLPDEFFVVDYFRWRQMDGAQRTERVLLLDFPTTEFIASSGHSPLVGGFPAGKACLFARKQSRLRCSTQLADAGHSRLLAELRKGSLRR
jgi:hypothetical protein